MKIAYTSILILSFAGVLSAQIPDFTPPTPFVGALMHNDTAEARKLLDQGADPNGVRFMDFPGVFWPVMHQNLDLLRAMVAKGADLEARDGSGSTALMWAAYNETGGTAIVEELLRLGMNPNTANKAGETALTWASKRGYPAIAGILRKAGATDTSAIKDSTERAIALLQKSSTEFMKGSGCVSCHHQLLPQITAAVARDRGLTVDDVAIQAQTKATIGMFEPVRHEIVKSKDRIPDPPITVSYALLALGSENYPKDETTEAMATMISHWQLADGRFKAFGMRPPIESSDFTATALSVRALQFYGKDVAEKVTRAKEWLRSATTKTGEDRAMQLLGLAWSNAKAEDIKKSVDSLLAQQRPDGGWAQLPNLPTDAYATGQALVALNRGGKLDVTHPAYQRGIAFLMRTQFADGSWLVRTRTFPFQRYKESGFPHGKDQWISAAGTSWAAMALSLTFPSAREQSKLFSTTNN